MRYDKIIGLKTILEYNLLPKINSFFGRPYTFSVVDGTSSLLIQGSDHPLDIFGLETSTTTYGEDGYR